MSMFNRNDQPPDPSQTDAEPVLVAQRKFRVRYIDPGTTGLVGDIVEEVITCRLVRVFEGLLIFSDAVKMPTGYNEFVALAISSSTLVSYREVFELPASGLIN